VLESRDGCYFDGEDHQYVECEHRLSKERRDKFSIYSH